MRERLAAAFVALTLAVLFVAGAVRTYALQDLFRDRERDHLARQAEVVAVAIEEEVRLGRPVNRRFLQKLSDPETRLEYVPPNGEALVVTGAAYDGQEDAVTAARAAPTGTVTISQRVEGATGLYSRAVGQLVTLLALLALLSGLLGWWLASRLAAPFQKLAAAAGALGRGRYDLTLPDSQIPEARAIAEALRLTAAQLQSRMSRERDFAEHASHVLRTPLTSLRLELEDLTLRDDVPEDVKDAAVRCMDRADRVNASAGQLVALTRSGSLVEGAEVSLEELAHAVAQSWADQLAGRRTVTMAVEGDPAVRVSPGPIEQLLDLVLPDVKHGRGPARVVFVGEEGHVRLQLTGSTVPGGSGARKGVAAARLLAADFGGRVTEAEHERDVEILLPRR